MAQKMAVQRARAHIRNSRKSREDVIFEYIIYIILALISLIIIYPLWFVLIASFSEAKLVVAGKVLWRPVGLTLDNYAECFKNGDLMIGYKNSLGILFLGTATNLVLTTLCCLPAVPPRPVGQERHHDVRHVPDVLLGRHDSDLPARRQNAGAFKQLVGGHSGGRHCDIQYDHHAHVLLKLHSLRASGGGAD